MTGLIRAVVIGAGLLGGTAAYVHANPAPGEYVWFNGTTCTTYERERNIALNCGSGWVAVSIDLDPEGHVIDTNVYLRTTDPVRTQTLREMP